MQKAGHKEGDAGSTGDQGFADLDPAADFFIEQSHPSSPTSKQPNGHWSQSSGKADMLHYRAKKESICDKFVVCNVASLC